MVLSAAIKQKANDLGFDLVGIAPLGAWKDLEFSRKWVEQGYGGEMRYLENPKRDDPRRVMPSARSVVCVGLVYNAPLPYSTEVQEKLEDRSHPSASSGPSIRLCSGPRAKVEGRAKSRGKSEEGAEGPRGWISRYAWGRDYHDVMRRMLEELRAATEQLAPGVETRIYVDTGPIVERAFARFSGIGWMGKNTCLINERKGSWFFLGVMLTSLALDPDLPAPDRCGSCTRCIEACPTDALVKPYVMDASRCIAYFTIELKGSIPPDFRPAVGANVVGCDICQDVCPWNSRNQKPEVRSQNTNDQPTAKGRGRAAAATTELPNFQPLHVTVESRAPNPEARDFSLFNPSLEHLASLTEEDFLRVFANSPVKRVKYRGWLRNLCVAMGNSGDRRFLPGLRELSAHADPIVREHAEWALERLEKNLNSLQLPAPAAEHQNAHQGQRSLGDNHGKIDASRPHASGESEPVSER